MSKKPTNKQALSLFKQKLKETKTTESPPLNATQKITALEAKMTSVDRNFEILAEEIDQLGVIIQELGRKINASIKAGADGDLSPDSVSKILVAENLKDLQAKVNFLIDQGILKRDDQRPVDNHTFVVGRELSNGKIHNPRLQFAVVATSEEFRASYLGKTVGDIIPVKDSDISVELVELYTIISPKDKNIKFDKDKGAALEAGLTKSDKNHLTATATKAFDINSNDQEPEGAVFDTNSNSQDPDKAVIETEPNKIKT